MIRILLVEPMNLLRGALAATLSLEEDFELVADLGGLDQALDMARAVPPDVAVVNIALLAGDGLRTIARLNAEQPGCATLVLAGPDDAGTAQPGAGRARPRRRRHPGRAVRAGARPSGSWSGANGSSTRAWPSRWWRRRAARCRTRELDVLSVVASGAPSHGGRRRAAPDRRHRA